MRWRFADPNNAAEMQYRNDMLAKFDEFWSEFAKNAHLFQSQDTLNQSIQWVIKSLETVHKGLMWEMSGTESRTFVITPENEYHLQPMIESMVARAPEIPGFRFSTAREPVLDENLEPFLKARAGRYLPDVQIAATTTGRNTIDLQFLSSQFHWSRGFLDINYCLALCEVALGQRILEERIGFVSSRNPNLSLVEKTKSLFGVKTIIPETTVPTSEFRRHILQLQEEQISKLPEEPLSKVKETLPAGLIEIRSAGANRRTAAGYNFSIIEGVKSPPACFVSERFSKCGETFCYLKIDESASAQVDRSDSLDRGQIEEAIDAALQKAGVGCVPSGGWGPAYNFIDLALTDVDTAIPILREESRRLALSHSTWLRFLDSKYSKEWVGMYPDTPEPDLSPDW